MVTHRVYHTPNKIILFYFFLASFIASLSLFFHGYLLSYISAFYFFVLFFILLMKYQVKQNEEELSIKKPENLLIIAPHQDDCVLMAGGLAIKNISFGGKVNIIYLSQDENSDVAVKRRAECERVWRRVGLENDCLLQRNVLPVLYEKPNQECIELTRKTIQNHVNEYKPTMVVFPIFEGGHRHHDITNYIASFLIKYPKRTILYEAPLYSMYYSFINTPQKLIKLITRFTSFNFLAYIPSVEGIDNRPISILNLKNDELIIKKKMLKGFVSQNGVSLCSNYGYADRLVLWKPNKYKPQAFEYKKNLSFFIECMYKNMPILIANIIYPTDVVSHGCQSEITDMDYELERHHEK